MLWPFGSPRRRRSGALELRWRSARAWTNRWYPQGIDLGIRDGRRTLAVSWFRQDRDRRHLASRVTFVDLERSGRVDVALAVEADDGSLTPAAIHAGGLAWFGDRMLVAATGQGIWEFDLARLRRVGGRLGRELAGRRGRGRRATALVAVRTRVHPIPLRCSFLGRVFDDDGKPLPRVLIGEFRPDDRGRIGEFAVPQHATDGFEELRRFRPGIPSMQGAVRWGRRHFLSQSDGLHPGTLWTGPADGLTRARSPLPAGTEDLALDLDDGLLWSLGEHPWRRVVRGIPLDRLGLGPGGRTGART